MVPIGPGMPTSTGDPFRNHIDGEWRTSSSGETMEATSPATGEVLGEVQRGSREDIRHAARAARDVHPELAETTAFERAERCHEIGNAIEDSQDELAEWLASDQGKPLHEATGEVGLCIEEFHNAAEDIKRLETAVIPSQDPNKRIVTVREPRGVYGIVTPWNFPVNIPAEYLAPGLAAGNAIVWVPAPTTSLVAVKLMEIISETSLPDGALNMVTGEGPVVGDEVVRTDLTDAIGFTGSPSTGESIAKAAGTKPRLLELGGNGPVIVLDDADLEAAVEGTATGSFTNAGQSCSASERVLVHETVHDEFVEKITEYAENITTGQPFEGDTEMGPLNNEGVASKMDRHIDDAIERGAELVTGGGRFENEPTDLYYQPTVLDDVGTDTAVNREESFGPVVPIIPFSDYEEAIRITNDIDLGLVSSVFTSDLALANQFAEEIETGIVNINASPVYWEIHTPFGGYTGKQSGEGRLGGLYTIEEMTQVKNVVTDFENVNKSS